MSIFSSLPILAACGWLLALGMASAQGVQTTPAAQGGQTIPPAGTAAPASTSAATEFLPGSYRADRHSSTWSRSPFSREVLPPAAGPTGPQGPTPWDGWQIAAIDKFGGEYTVGLISKKNEFHLLKVGEANDDGVKITKVESSGVIGDTVVHLTDGTRSGEISFDSKRLTTAAKGAPVQKAAAKGKVVVVRAPGRPVTPQQTAATQAARQKAAAQLHSHLQNAATTGGPADGTPAAGAPGTPRRSSASRVRRRSVVLPPSSSR